MRCPLPHVLLLVMLCVPAFGAGLVLGDVAPIDVAESSEKLALRKWFLHFGAANAYPKMESEKLVDYYDGMMKALAPGYDDVKTIGDLRDQHLLWPPQIGFGVVLSLD